MTIPCNAYYLSFNTYNVEVSVGLVLAALFSLAAFKWAFEGDRWSLLNASVAAMLSTAIYQSLAIVDAVGIAALVLLHLLSLPPEARPRAADSLRRLVLCAVPLFICYAGNAAIAALTSPATGYVDIFFNWGKLDTAFIINWLRTYVEALFGGGGFIGGEIV